MDNTAAKSQRSKYATIVDPAASTQFTGINESLRRAFGAEKRKMFAQSAEDGKELELRIALSWVNGYGNRG